MTMNDCLDLCHEFNRDPMTIANMHSIVIPWLQKELNELRAVIAIAESDPELDEALSGLRADAEQIEAAMAAFETRLAA